MVSKFLFAINPTANELKRLSPTNAPTKFWQSAIAHAPISDQDQITQGSLLRTITRPSCYFSNPSEEW
ncbi:uncharacterized protein TrAFT101_008969 [Trichoderma asperellum]|uniref:uncharacterized protein n=1 Tax=Trichoderma asperellum TaxID=101201 RepID=UPI00331B07E0|nr:hypothetical protein TrAFT101_008969 [Trichoderma asperellum]